MSGGNGSAARLTPGALLALDAAPGVGSVALTNGGVVVASRAVPMRGGREDDPLMRAVDDVLHEAELRARDLAGVACGAGPGGFTGLRIAASLAKGIAHAAGLPLLAAPSLAWAAAVRAPAAGRWLVTLDALRGESYAAAVALGDTLGHVAGGARAVAAYEYLGIHATASVEQLAARFDANGTIPIDADIERPPIALGVAALAPSPVDLARWEPAYGRVAEAQAKWEVVHGPLPTATPGVV